jgi:nucleoid-associated protein YgaU
MPNLIENLTSIAPELRSGPSPGRRLLALVLCAMLTLGVTFPGFAFAGEADSEGEGTAAPIEVPVGPPDFDPGGEETDLEEAPVGGEEGGAVEAEAEVGLEAPPTEEATGVATEAPVEAVPLPPVDPPELAISTPEPEPVPQGTSDPSEPVANESIVAPRQNRVEHHAASESAVSDEATRSQLASQAAPPQPVALTQADPGRSLAGKDSYIVQPGDCLWHIAASLLSASADTDAIAAKVEHLWRLNEDRIGTGDPNLIYAGTELRLR